MSCWPPLLPRLLTALPLLLVGCDETATQIVVVVDSDIVRSELGVLRVEVRGGSGELSGKDPDTRTIELEVDAGGGEQALPLSFGVTPKGGDATRRVEVRVTGARNRRCLAAPSADCPVVDRVARTGFVEHKRLRLPMFLWDSCLDVSCEPGRTCANGTCISATVAPETLDVISPGGEPGGEIPGRREWPDAAEPPTDSGVMDAGGDDADAVPDGAVDGGGDADAVPDGAVDGSADADVTLDGAACEGPSCVWFQRGYLKASNTGTDDALGTRVSLSADGTVLAVGAWGEDSAATGVDGVETNNGAPDSGAAYVFRRSGGVWRQEAYLKASNTDSADYLGYGVSLSADGTALALGAWGEGSAATGVDGDESSNSASNSGAVYVFRRVGVAWGQEAYLKASNGGLADWFGFSVSLSADGSALAVGAYFEASAATGVGGDGADNTASSSGAAYVFRRAAGVWSQEAYLKASNTGMGDRFGYSVSLSADGTVLAVGANREGSAATGVDGNQASDTATGSGAVYVFRYTAGMWSQEAYLKASNTGAGDFFGNSVSLSADGAALAVGAFLEASAATGVDGDQADDSAAEAGAVYVFRHAAGTWSQEAYVKASNAGAGDRFGASIALLADGSALAVGAHLEDSLATGVDGDQANDGASGSGAVYVFRHVAGVWSQEAYLKASNAGATDSFGISVALAADGSGIAVGAWNEDSAATGADGDDADNSAADSGAVYAFEFGM